MTSLQGPYEDAYRDADHDEPECQYGPGCPACERREAMFMAGQGRTLADVNADARAVEFCIVAALLLAALVWVLA